jgi:hypothetical protein
MVKAIEYHPDGVSVKRVEFKTAMDYPQSHVFVPGATPDLRFNPGQGLPFHPGQSYGPIGMGSVATTRTQQFQDEAAVTPQVQG